MSLITVNTVFASDVNNTITSTEDSNQEFTSITENNTLLQQSESFRTLSSEIRNNQGNEFNLSNDYSFDTWDVGLSDGIPISRNITINGNGHTLDADSNGRIFKITDDGLNVVLKNINFINGKIKENGGAIYGKCTVINCTFTNNLAEKGGALYKASAINCTFDRNSAKEGGAIYIDDPNILIENCTFINNIVTEFGGAISINEVTGSTITNCTFRENKARYGGSVSVRYSIKTHLSNSEFISNQASIEGGAIHYEFALQNTLFNSYFENNIAGQNGGALTWILSNGNMTGNRFKRNTATGNGGAIFADISNTTALMDRQVFTDCNFTGNSAKNGGALYCGEFYRISNGTFSFIGNSARENGGAVYCKDSCSFLNSLFINNTAQDNGGGLYSNDNLNIFGSTFINNYAQDNGGGIFTNNSAFIFDNQFINNSAYNGGGLYTNNGGTVSKASFINNSAEYEGGAIYCYRNSLVYNIKFNNNSALYGGAVYCDRDNEFAYNEFTRNYASKGPALYTENTHNVIDNTVFLQNKQEYTNLGITQNDFMISFKLLDDKYHFNAIYSWFNIECSNITYWNGTITSTEDMDTQGGAGINFTIEVFDSNNNLVEKLNSSTDNRGRLIYDYFHLDGGRYTIKISHEEDDYYPEFSQNYTIAFGDFAKLQTLLSQARDYGIINLTRNYTFSIGFDTLKYFNVYSENLTINGNGYTIDGSNQGTSFSLNNMKNINFNNITFANGVNFNIRSENFLISDCDFENITNLRLSQAQSLQIINCNFDNHNNESFYGACNIHDNEEVIIKDCNFTNINANGADGAAITLNNNNVESIINCNFINNTDSSRAGAIYGRNLKNLYLVNCSFTNNSANAGGALNLGTAKDGKINIDGCQFTENTANGSGGAMDVTGETHIENSVFLNNKASSKSIEMTADLDTITINFKGSDNYINAINSLGRLSFDNVTYWDGTVTNTNVKTPIESSPGVNITIKVYDKDDNLIFQTIEKTDENGQVIYDIFKLPYETKYVMCYHEDDNYYAGSLNASKNVTRIGDFDRLQRLINDAGENGVVNLTRNYTYSDDFDTISYLTINYNNITINGNGHSISFSEKGFIYIYDDTDGTTLNNITFTDGGSQWSPIFSGGNCEINDCNFINNNLGSNNANIQMSAHNLTVKNTNFINTSGNAIILSDGASASIYNSNFINNTRAILAGTSDGMKNLLISGSNFVNNSDIDNVALELKAEIVMIENSNFTNNKGTAGGAIKLDGTLFNITDCTFTGNTAKGDGGALYLKAEGVYMNDCTFTSNTANGNVGGAIYAKTYVSTINGSEFYNNSANLGGGAIYSETYLYLNAYNSIFRFNSANIGSAIYGANGMVVLRNSTLLDNKAQSKSILQDGDIVSDIIIKFEGNDNYINAIYSNSVEFDNVTYWNGKVVNSDDVSPVEGICSGQNITIEIYDDENNLVDNTTMVSDGQNKIYYNLVNLGNGDYTFKAYHIADNYYSYIGGCEGTFLINRTESTVNIDIDPEIELFYPNFKISFNITHKTVSRVVITNANGTQVYFDEIVDDDYVIVDLDPSEEYYNITVYNNPTLSYLGSQDSKLFKVSKILPSININPIPDTNYNNMFNVTFDGENLETVNLTVFDIHNNIVYNEITTNKSVSLPVLPVGTYNITITTKDDRYHSKAISSITINITPATNNVQVIVENVTYGNVTTVVVVADVDGNYTVDVNGTILNVTVTGNRGNATLSLGAGKYYANATYDNGNYSSNITNTEFEVYPAVNNIIISVDNVTYGNVTTVVVVADVDGNYTVDVNGTILNVTVTGNHGNATLSLGAGNYYANATFTHENYSSNATNAIFEVYKAMNNGWITVYNAVYGREVEVIITPEVNGVYSIDVNGTIRNVNVTNYIGFFRAYFDVGSYYVNVTFDNGNYSTNIPGATFNVTKANNDVVVYVYDVTYGEDTVIEISAGANGVYAVEINGTITNVTVKDYRGYLTLSLGAGKYYTNVTFENENYVTNVTNTLFEVYPAMNNVNVSVGNVTYGEEAIIVVSADADGVYAVNVNGTILNVTVVNNTGNASISLGVGKYYANATFENANYSTNITNATFEVYKAVNNVNVSVGNVTYGENAVIVVSADADGDYIVDVNGTILNVTVVNNTGNASISLGVGKYYANATFENANYSTNITNATFEVYKAVNNVEVIAGNVVYGEDAIIIVLAEVDGNYTVDVNGTIRNVIVKDHVGNFTLSLTVGSYYANAYFESDNYVSNITNAVFEVYKAVNNIKVIANSVTYGKDVVLEVVADVDGNYTLDFNGNVTAIEVVNGKYSTNLTLGVGKYYANVTFNDGNYSAVISNAVFEVYRAVNNVRVIANSVTYGKDVVLEVVADVDGNYTLDFNGNVTAIEVVNGKYSTNLTLGVGKYYANVTFNDGNYSAVISNAVFEVYKAVNNIKVLVGNVVYGNDARIIVAANVDGVYTVDVNGTIRNVTVVNNTGNFTLSLNAGKYYANVTFENGNYSNIIYNAIFEVSKAQNNVRVSVDNVSYGEKSVIRVNADVDGVYILDFNGDVSTIEVVNGNYSTSLSLGVGKYYANVTFDNDNYATAITNAVFEVYKAMNNVKVVANSVAYGEDVVIIVYADVDGNYTLDFNGETSTIEVVNGNYSKSLSLGLGKYYANVTFESDNYISNITNAVFEVYKAVNNVEVIAGNVVYGENAIIFVLADVDGVYTVDVNGTIKNVTVVNRLGNFTLSLGAGTYYANASFENDNYVSNIINTTFEVYKAVNHIKVSANNVNYGKDVLLKVTADVDGNYTLDFNGSVTTIEVVNGNYSTSLSLAAGKYYANVTFDNGNYSSISTNARFEVYKAMNTVRVTVKNVVYGDESVIVVYADVDGNYTLDINGDVSTVEVVDGSYSTSLRLAAGKYYANVTFANDNYATTITNATFEVYKAVNNVKVLVNRSMYSDVVNIEVIADVDGNYTLDINGNVTTIEVVNGKYSVELHLTEGKYYVNVTFDNGNYSNYISNSEFELNDTVNNVKVTANSVTYGKNVIIEVIADVDGNYSLDINGDVSTVEIVNGRYSTSLSLGVGKYYANVTFDNDNYTTAITNAVFEVYKAVNNVRVVASNVAYGKESVIVVYADVDGNYTLDINGDDSTVEVVGGNYSTSVHLAVGKYYANVTFDDGNYSNIISNAVFEVYPAMNNIRVIANSVTYGKDVVLEVVADVDGNYTLDFNGDVSTVEVVNGRYSRLLSLAAGKYYANVTFYNRNYTSTIINAVFEVYKAVNNIKVLVGNVVYGNDALIIVAANVNGEYTVDVNGTIRKVTLVNNTGNFTLSLNAGKYYANVTFKNDNYSNIISNSVFEVYKAKNNVKVSVNNVTYGQESVIIVTADANGVYDLNIDGNTRTIEVINGTYSISLNLTVGKHYANVTFDDGNYSTVITNAVFEVYKAVNNVKVVANSVAYGEDVVIIVSADVDGNYTLNFNGDTSTIEVVNGNYSQSLSLGVGKYWANVTFDDDNYSTVITNAVFEVYKAVNNVEVVVGNVVYGENATIFVLAEVDGVYTVDVNGTIKNVNVINNVGNFTLSLDAGTYYANASFESENYVSNIINTTFEVYKAVNHIKVSVNNVIYGNEAVLKVTADVDGNYTLDFNGSVTTIEVVNGNYSTSLSLVAGKYYANVTFDNGNYSSISTNAKFEVYKARNTVRVEANSVTYGKDVVLVIVADVDGNYTLDFNGDTSTIEVVNGNYSTSLSLPAGKYYANVAFDNDNYATTITNATFEVYKAVNNVKVIVPNVVYGNDALIIVLANVNGEYTVNVNGTIRNVTVVNNTANFTLSLNAGKYYANVTFENDNYSNLISNAVFEVYKAVNNVKVSVNNVTYGQESEIIVTADANGVYTLDINGNVTTINVVNGSYSTSLHLSAGKYYANVTFDNDNYITTIANAMFEVKAVNNVRVVAGNVTYGEDSVIFVYADVDDLYHVDVNGTSRSVNVVNGSGNVTLHLGAGTYYANASYVNPNYSTIITNAAFEVSPAENNVVVSVEDVAYGEDSVIFVSADASGVYEINVNGTLVNVTVVNGSGNVTLHLGLGSYYANASYVNPNYSTSITNAVFEVYPAENNVVVSVGNVTYGEDSVIVVTADVDALYRVYVNGTIFNVTVVNGTGNVTLRLGAGSYYANASYVNPNYSTSITNAVFEVYPAVNNVVVSVEDVAYGEDSVIVVTADVDALYCVDVNGTFFNVTVVNGSGNVTLHLGLGSYYANASYVNPNYSISITNAVFEVYPAENNVIVSVDNVTYGEDSVIVVTADVDALYCVDVNGTFFNVTVVNGSGNVTLHLGAGKYYANTTFTNENYSAMITNAVFEVYPAVNNVVVSVDNVTYGEDSVIVVTADVDALYCVDVNGTFFNVTVVNGSGNVTLHLAAGIYYANAYYVNANYSINSTNSVFEVSKAPNTVQIMAYSLEYTGEYLYGIYATVDGVYTVDLNGTIRNVTVGSSFGFDKLSLGVGSYYANVTFNNANYSTTSVNAVFEIYPAENNVQVIANNATYSGEYEILIKADADGVYTVDVNGTIKNVTVVGHTGKVTFSLGVGTYYANASFVNGNYSTKITNAVFEISPAVNNVVVSVDNVTYGEVSVIVVSADLDGVYKVDVNGTILNITVSGNRGYNTLYLGAGRYYANTSYYKENYSTIITNAEFEVYKAVNNVVVSVDNVTYGDESRIIVSADADGVYEVDVNGTIVNVTVFGNIGYGTLHLGAGKYYANASYYNGNYSNKITNDVFEVYKALNAVKVIVNSVTYGDMSRIIVSADADGVYKVNVNGTIVNVTVSGNRGYTTLPLGAGKYYANASFENSNYSTTITNAEFEVYKAINNVRVIVNNITYGEAFMIFVSADADGVYKVDVNGTFVNVTVSGNRGYTTLPLGVGKYYANASFENGNYTSNIINAIFEISIGVNNVVVSVDNVTYGNKSVIVVSADVDGIYVLNVNGTIVNVTVVNNTGNASLSLGAGKYYANASYYNENYITTITNASFEVYRAVNNVMVSVENVTYNNASVIVVSADVDGIYVLNVNGTIVNVTVVNNTGNASLSLGAGKYYANVTFDNDNYTSNITNAVFEVYKALNNVQVMAYNVTYTGQYLMAVLADADGVYVLDVNGTIVNVTVTGTIGYTILPLGVGKYYANVTFDNGNYSNNITNAVFEISKAQNEVRVLVDNVFYGNASVIIVSADADGVYTVDVNGTLVNVTVMNHVGNFTLRLNVGRYYANVTSDNGNYTTNSINDIFEVYKAVNNVKVIANNVAYGQDIVLEVVADVDGNYTLDFNGDIITINVVNGTYSKSLHLAAGKYYANVTFDDGNYSTTVTNAVFEVYKATNNVKVSANSVTYGEEAVIVVSADVDGNYTLDFNGDISTIEVVNGTYSSSLRLAAGKYYANVTFDNGNYSTTVTNASFEVYKAVNNVEINIILIDFDEDAVLEVVADVDGNYTLNFNGNVTTIEVVNGKYNISLSLADGSYYANVTFDNENYSSTIADIMFVIDHFVNNVKVGVSSVTYGKESVIVVTADVDGLYTVDVNGTITNVTVKDHRGNFTLSLGAGRYYANVTFEDGIHTNIITNGVFEVYKALNNVKVSANSVAYGDESVIVVSADVDGNYTLDFNGNTTTIEVVNGNYSSSLRLAVGSYYANVTFDNGNYSTIITNAVFEVNPAVNNVRVIANSVVYGNDVVLQVVADVDGNYTLDFNGTVTTIEVVNGKYNISLSLYVGKYYANVTFENGNYSTRITNAVFEVHKAINNIKVIANSVTYGNGTVIVVLADVDGVYSVDVNGTIRNVTVANKRGNVTLYLGVGKYYANVTFENGNYSIKITNAVFEVYKEINTVQVNVNNVTYGSESVIVVSADVDGVYNIDVNGTIVNVIVVNGTGNTSVSLGAGKYYANVTFESDNYTYNITNAVFEVYKVENNVQVIIHNATYGENLVIEVVADIDGVYNIDINGENHTINVANGTGSISLILDAGEYYINVSFIDSNYDLINSSVTFKVLPATEYEIEINAGYSNGVHVYAILPHLATGNLTIRIADNNYTKEINNGIVLFDPLDLNAGDVNVTVHYDGDNNYVSKTFNMTVHVKRIMIDAYDVKYGWANSITYSVKLINEYGNAVGGKQVLISINGKTYKSITDDNGIAAVSLSLSIGTYDIKISHLSENVVRKISVVSRFSGNKNINMYYFDGSKYTFKVYGDDGNVVGANQNVVIKLNKKTYNVKTNKDGVVSFTIPKTLKKLGSYTITATYKGQTIKNTVKVKQILTSKKKVKVKKTAKKLVLKAKLKKKLKGKKIIFKFKGKKYKTKTNKKGIAKIKINKKVIKKLKKGKTYKVIISYYKINIKTKIKVK